MGRLCYKLHINRVDFFFKLGKENLNKSRRKASCHTLKVIYQIPQASIIPNGETMCGSSSVRNMKGILQAPDSVM